MSSVCGRLSSAAARSLSGFPPRSESGRFWRHSIWTTPTLLPIVRFAMTPTAARTFIAHSVATGFAGMRF